ncbi:patched family protein [Toxoplasma gondii GAB2-2007-GAL-DOM2]|uniref:Patched family protein n=5 Tax=Toxoplasma gondii TaxID=5811 RepID=S7UP99_TOXGG|nr:patched family protein [Toxoplasma gondii GT1]KAF4644527.1 patched family protein [Toxoplasma gondii]KFG41318.1 patched family protein [Toxoplasma gondii FOU]KFG42305.1 patched family protein [Toxoplasma gondii GAB2-2007-GAL-DOM2]RQX73639.1 patched family protein [Toxoplasma gondii CAST]
MEKNCNSVAGHAGTLIKASSRQADDKAGSRVPPGGHLLQTNKAESQLLPCASPSDPVHWTNEIVPVVADTSAPAEAAPDQTVSDGEQLTRAPDETYYQRSESPAEPPAENELPAGRSRRRRSRWCLGCGCFEQVKTVVLRILMTGFEKYAGVVYDHPWLFIMVSLLATAGMSVGIFLRTPESDVYTLYSLSGSPSQVTKEHLLDVLPPDRLLFVLLTGTSNIVTRETVTRIDSLLQGIESITLRRDSVTTDEFNHRLVSHDRSPFPETITFQDICAKDGSGKCQVQSILDLYPSSSAWGVMPIASASWPVVTNPVTHKVSRLDAILGKITTSVRLAEQGSGRPALTVVEEAEAMLMRIDLRGETIWKPYTAAFEKLVLDYVLGQDFGPDISVTAKAERSSYDELKRVSTLDVVEWLRLCAAVLVVFLYTSVVNSSKTHRTKLVPSAMGALASLLGYLGGAGLVYLCGVRHTTPAEATPFLAIGIGVDDLFVIINAYSLTYLHPNPKERVVDAIRDAGLSITITTLTNVITFIIGALSPYYSISMFCIITAGALTWGYVLCLTFFLAGLSLDARREARKEPLSYSLFWRFMPRCCRKSSYEPQLSPPLPLTAAASGLEEMRNESEEIVTADQTPPTHGGDLLTTYQLAALMVLYKKHTCQSRSSQPARRLFDRRDGTGTEETMSTPVPEDSERDRTNQKSCGTQVSTGIVDVRETGQDAASQRQLSSHIRDMTTQESMMLLKNFEKEMEQNPEKLLKLYHPEPLGNPGRGSRRFFRDYYGRFLGNTFVKATVLVIFAAVTALAIYGATTLKFGLSLKNITPQASYLRDFYSLHEDLFPSYGDEVTVFFAENDRWEDREVQMRYLQMVKELSEQEWAVVVTDGMSLFLQHAMPSLHSGNRKEFLALLKTWLEGDPIGQNFSTFFKFSFDNLIVWQFRYWMPHRDNTTTLYYWLKEGKDIVSAGKPYFHGEVHTALAVIWESDPKILPFTLTNLSIALVCILAISLLLIPDLTSAIIVVLVVSLVDLWLFGFMALIDLPLSMISMVNLLISIGYSVDFTIHVAHTFTHCVGASRKDRMVETMIVMGAPVTHGMLSTLLSILALAGSPKYILEVFFKMMFMVIVFAYTAGMVLLPVVLTLLGPFHPHGKRESGKAIACDSSAQLIDMEPLHGTGKEEHGVGV